MGYNTVAVILNDALDVIERDKDIGQRIRDAALGWLRRDRDRFAVDVTARTEGGGAHVGAIRIIGQDHADHYQVIVAGRNTGWSLDYDRDVPPAALEAIADALRNHGYRVTKPKRPAGD